MKENKVGLMKIERWKLLKQIQAETLKGIKKASLKQQEERSLEKIYLWRMA